MSGLHFSDYQRPVLLQQSDYRSATARSHHFKTASDRNFIEKSSRTLCDLFSYGAQPLKNLLVSESKDQLRYKINSRRNDRQELAQNLKSVNFISRHADTINSNTIIRPIDCYQKYEIQPFSKQLPEPFVCTNTSPLQMKTEWKEPLVANSGFLRLADPMQSRTTVDFILHDDYQFAKTKLITRKEFIFNANKPLYNPKSFLLQTYPTCNKYRSEIIKDTRSFEHPIADRIIPRRNDFVPYTGLTTEMTASY